MGSQWLFGLGLVITVTGICVLLRSGVLKSPHLLRFGHGRGRPGVTPVIDAGPAPAPHCSDATAQATVATGNLSAPVEPRPAMPTLPAAASPAGVAVSGCPLSATESAHSELGAATPLMRPVAKYV